MIEQLTPLQTFALGALAGGLVTFLACAWVSATMHGRDRADVHLRDRLLGQAAGLLAHVADVGASPHVRRRCDSMVDTIVGEIYDDAPTMFDLARETADRITQTDDDDRLSRQRRGGPHLWTN